MRFVCSPACLGGAVAIDYPASGPFHKGRGVFASARAAGFQPQIARDPHSDGGGIVRGPGSHQWPTRVQVPTPPSPCVTDTLRLSHTARPSHLKSCNESKLLKFLHANLHAKTNHHHKLKAPACHAFPDMAAQLCASSEDAERKETSTLHVVCSVLAKLPLVLRPQ